MTERYVVIRICKKIVWHITEPLQTLNVSKIFAHCKARELKFEITVIFYQNTQENSLKYHWISNKITKPLIACNVWRGLVIFQTIFLKVLMTMYFLSNFSSLVSKINILQRWAIWRMRGLVIFKIIFGHVSWLVQYLSTKNQLSSFKNEYFTDMSCLERFSDISNYYLESSDDNVPLHKMSAL